MSRGLRWYLVCVGVLAVTCFTAVAGGAADANDNMYKTSNARWNCFDGTMSNGLFCQTDNATLTLFMQESVSSGLQTTIRNMLASLDSTTHVASSNAATA